MNKHFIFIIVLLISFISCNKEDKIIERYDNGSIKAIHYYKKHNLDSSHLYYPSQRLKQVVHFNVKDTLGYTISYKEDGTKQTEGYIVNNYLDYRVGKWHLYGRKTDSIVEYINVNEQPYVNQVWVLDRKTKDTIYDKGNFFNIFNQDTVFVGEVLKFRFYLFQPYFSYNSDMLVVIPKNDNELNIDFSNIFEIQKDTFHSLKNDGIPHLEIPKEVPQNHNSNFGIIYENIGEKRVRGYISEYVKDKENTTKRMERILFFDKKIYVKDTVD